MAPSCLVGVLDLGFNCLSGLLQIRRSSTSSSWFNHILKSGLSGMPTSTGLCLSYSLGSSFCGK
ncbi:unnamed protein product [Brassica oleracea]